MSVVEQSNDVWARLYEAEAFIRADTLMAAAIGAAANPVPLIDEVEKAALWVADKPERLAHLIPMLLVLGKSSLEMFATTVEEAKLETAGYLTPDADPEAVRDTMLYLLRAQVDQLREQLG